MSARLQCMEVVLWLMDDWCNIQVIQRLQGASSPAMRTKLAELLAAAARGIGANPTAGAADLLVFVHGVLHNGLAAEEAAAAAAQAAAEAAGQADGECSATCAPLASDSAVDATLRLRFWGS